MKGYSVTLQLLIWILCTNNLNLMSASSPPDLLTGVRHQKLIIPVAQADLKAARENACFREGVCPRFWNCSFEEANKQIVCTSPCQDLGCKAGEKCFLDESGRAACSSDSPSNQRKKRNSGDTGSSGSSPSTPSGSLSSSPSTSSGSLSSSPSTSSGSLSSSPSTSSGSLSSSPSTSSGSLSSSPSTSSGSLSSSPSTSSDSLSSSPSTPSGSLSSSPSTPSGSLSSSPSTSSGSLSSSPSTSSGSLSSSPSTPSGSLSSSPSTPSGSLSSSPSTSSGSLSSSPSTPSGSLSSSPSTPSGSLSSSPSTPSGSLSSSPSTSSGSLSSSPSTSSGSLSSSPSTPSGSLSSSPSTPSGSLSSSPSTSSGSLSSSPSTPSGSLSSSPSTPSGSLSSSPSTPSGSLSSSPSTPSGSPGNGHNSTRPVSQLNNTTKSTNSSSGYTSTTSNEISQTTTTANASQYTKPFDEIPFSVPFTIKFSGNFTSDLENKTSPEFKNKSAEYEKQLTGAFNSTDGFKSVTVTRFWNGSIGVDYTVEFKASVDITKQYQNTVMDKLRHLVYVDANYINSTFKLEMEGAIRILQAVQKDPCTEDGVCPLFWTCSYYKDKNVTCTSPCLKFECQASGTCFLDKFGNATCRCPPDDHYVYGGDHCEQKAEKLDLSKKTIIAIACGAGGGLVLILFIALVATCCKRHKSSAKGKSPDHEQQSEASFQSMTGTNGMAVGPAHFPSRLYRQHPGEVPQMATFVRQDSGLPMEAMDRPDFRPHGPRQDAIPPSTSEQIRRGDDGRIYRVVKDSQIYVVCQHIGKPFVLHHISQALHRRMIPDQCLKAKAQSLCTGDVLECMRVCMSSIFSGMEPTPLRIGSQAAFKNPAFESTPENKMMHDRRTSEPGFHRSSQVGRPRSNVYNEIDDEILMYQPSDVLPRTRFSNLSQNSHLNTAGANEYSDFPRRDDVPFSGDHRMSGQDFGARFSDRSRASSRINEHPGTQVQGNPAAQVLPHKDTLYPVLEPRSLDRQDVYPPRGEEVYSRPNKGRRPSHGEDPNPLIHDYTPRQPGPGSYSPYERHAGGHGHVFDFMPEDKVSIQRPNVSSRNLRL